MTRVEDSKSTENQQNGEPIFSAPRFASLRERAMRVIQNVYVADFFMRGRF